MSSGAGAAAAAAVAAEAAVATEALLPPTPPPLPRGWHEEEDVQSPPNRREGVGTIDAILSWLLHYNSSFLAWSLHSLLFLWNGMSEQQQKERKKETPGS